MWLARRSSELKCCQRLDANRAGSPAAGRGMHEDMATNVEIETALAAVAATANDLRLEEFDPRRVQELVTQAPGTEMGLTVDEGGGLHDETGARVGMIRRTDSGEWITERQNSAAERSDAAVPSPPPMGKLHRLLKKLRVAIS
jgi:hypothetical protein